MKAAALETLYRLRLTLQNMIGSVTDHFDRHGYAILLKNILDIPGYDSDDMQIPVEILGVCPRESGFFPCIAVHGAHTANHPIRVRRIDTARVNALGRLLHGRYEMRRQFRMSSHEGGARRIIGRVIAL